MARRRHIEEPMRHEAWAIPYGDLITLLLAFFIVMYSISSVTEGKYRVVSQALEQAFSGRLASGEGTGAANSEYDVLADPDLVWSMAVDSDPVQALLDHLDAVEAQGGGTPMERLANDITRTLAPMVVAGKIRVRTMDDRVEVDIGSDLLFASGSAQGTQVAAETLRALGGLLVDLPNEVRVEGHTDNVPIHTILFPSNWELSAARAAWVVRMFAEQGFAADRLSVHAFGDQRPVADNATREGRDANRRVTVIILGAAADLEALKALSGAAGGAAADGLEIQTAPVDEP